MALALFMRSPCKINSSTILLNVARLSTVAVAPQIQQQKQQKSISSAIQDNKISPLIFDKNLTLKFNPSTRNISLSAPKQSAAAGGSHTALWTAEKALSAALLAVIPAAFIYPSQPLDALLAVSIVIHQHWGLEAIVTDYIRPAWFGSVAPKIGHGLLLLISAGTLGGLLYFIYNDIGIANAVRKLWAIKGQ